jgi:hypothetical protein
VTESRGSASRRGGRAWSPMGAEETADLLRQHDEFPGRAGRRDRAASRGTPVPGLPRSSTGTLGYCISRERNRRSPGRGGVGIAFWTFEQRPSDQACLRTHPFWCRIRPPEGRGGRPALFKRIEEEKGLCGWTPSHRRGIRTVAISHSAITGAAAGDHYRSRGHGPDLPAETSPSGCYGVVNPSWRHTGRASRF